MQQISPPLRIALIAIVLLGAVWFVALRPKPDTSAEAPLPAAPGVAGLNRAVAKADVAAATASKAAAAEQATGADATPAPAGAQATKSTKVTRTPGATKVTKTTTVKPAAKPAKAVNPAAPLLAALKRGQVVVLLFRNSSSDSDSVATLVRSIGKRKKVVARVVRIKDVGRYQTFTAQSPVAQAPTTMIIGPRKRAKVIVGFTSVGELSQAVADVRRAGAAKS